MARLGGAGSVTMLVLGLAFDNSLWFLAVAILVGAAVVGRLIGLVADRFEKAALPPLIVELVLVGVLLATHFVLG